MVVGRLLYGIGCEPIYIAQKLIITMWFSDIRELQMAMGFYEPPGLLAQYLCGYTVPEAYQSFGLGGALSYGTYFSILSLVLVLLYIVIDIGTRPNIQPLVEDDHF